MNDTAKSSLLVLFFVNIFIKFAMNQVLSQVQNQAMIIHFMVLQLNYASISTFYFGLLIEFATFDLFYMKDTHAYLFNFKNIEWSA